jgi:hypothetical protein
MTLPALVSRIAGSRPEHPVLRQMKPFVEHVSARVREQSRRLGFYPESAPGLAQRCAAMAAGTLLFARSQLARSRSQLDKNYLSELGINERSR